MNSKTGDESSENLITPENRPNLQPITLDLTEIEIFAIVSTVQIAAVAIPQHSLFRGFAKQVAKKMHDSLDPNSQFFLHLKKGWDSEEADKSSLYQNFPQENFSPEGISDG
jgi:hypothetical protein